MRAATASVAALPAEVAATRSELIDEVRTARRDVLARSERQIAALRRDVLAGSERDSHHGGSAGWATRWHEPIRPLRRVEELRGDLQPVLAAAQSTLHNTDRTMADLHPQTARPGSRVEGHGGGDGPDYARRAVCCAEFLAQGQHITANVDMATSEFSGVATNLNRLTKPKWYDRLLGYGLNGAVIYRNLNPVTSIAVKGAAVCDLALTIMNARVGRQGKAIGSCNSEESI